MNKARIGARHHCGSDCGSTAVSSPVSDSLPQGAGRPGAHTVVAIPGTGQGRCAAAAH